MLILITTTACRVPTCVQVDRGRHPRGCRSQFVRNGFQRGPQAVVGAPDAQHGRRGARHHVKSAHGERGRDAPSHLSGDGADFGQDTTTDGFGQPRIATCTTTGCSVYKADDCVSGRVEDYVWSENEKTEVDDDDGEDDGGATTTTTVVAVTRYRWWLPGNERAAHETRNESIKSPRPEGGIWCGVSRIFEWVDRFDAGGGEWPVWWWGIGGERQLSVKSDV